MRPVGSEDLAELRGGLFGSQLVRARLPLRELHPEDEEPMGWGVMLPKRGGKNVLEFFLLQERCEKGVFEK